MRRHVKAAHCHCAFTSFNLHVTAGLMPSGDVSSHDTQLHLSHLPLLPSSLLHSHPHAHISAPMLSFFPTSPSSGFLDELGHGGRIQLRVSASEDCAQVPFEICCRSAMIGAVTLFLRSPGIPRSCLHDCSACRPKGFKILQAVFDKLVVSTIHYRSSIQSCPRAVPACWQIGPMAAGP